jgi:hypothetical protein
MSKRHKHKHISTFEHMRQSFITEDQLLILILVILIFSDRPKPRYSSSDRCKYCCNDKCKYNYNNKDNYGCSGESEHNYNEIEDKTDSEELKSYSSKDLIYSAEAGFQLDPTPTNDFQGISDSNANDKGEDVGIEKNNSPIADASIDEVCEKTIEELPTEKPVVTYSKVTVCSSTILQSCPNDTIVETPSLTPVVSKIPIIISQPQLQILIESLTRFPEPVFQVKTMDKRVFLDSCQLILGSDKIFIKGFIREDVEYCTADCITPTSINGNIKKITFNIPFHCSSKVLFDIQPQVFSSSHIFDLEVIDPSTNIINVYEKSQGDLEILNEKVFAELCSSKILATDIQEEIKQLDNIKQEAYTFEKMRKKIVLTLKLDLLQRQKIFIYNPANNNSNESCYYNSISDL